MDAIASHAASKPDAPAVIEGERRLTWRAFHERRARLAHGVAALGVRHGEHVIVYAPNSTEYLVASAAARAIGTIPVPMNHRLTADEVAYILDDSDAAPVFGGDPCLAIAEAGRAGASRVRQWVTIGRQRRPWAAHLDDLVAASAGDVAVDPGANVGGSMIYTAGTRGKPRGARRRRVGQPALRPRLRAFALARPHVNLVAGPLYHSAPGAFALYTQIFGGTNVVMPKFDPDRKSVV